MNKNQHRHNITQSCGGHYNASLFQSRTRIQDYQHFGYRQFSFETKKNASILNTTPRLFHYKTEGGQTYFSKTQNSFTTQPMTTLSNTEQQYLLNNDLSFLETANQYEPLDYSSPRIQTNSPRLSYCKDMEAQIQTSDGSNINCGTYQQENRLTSAMNKKLNIPASSFLPLTTVQEQWSKMWKNGNSNAHNENRSWNDIFGMPSGITNDSKLQQKHQQKQQNQSTWSKSVDPPTSIMYSSPNDNVNSVNQHHNIAQPKPEYFYQKIFSVSKLEKAIIQDCTISEETNSEKMLYQKIINLSTNATKLLSNSISFHSAAAVNKCASVLNQTCYVAQISNIPWSSSTQDIASTFSHSQFLFDTISQKETSDQQHIHILVNTSANKTQKVAFVEFNSEEDLKLALKELKNPLFLKGRNIFITRSDEETLFRNVFREWNGLFISGKPTYFANDDEAENGIFLPPRLVEKYEYNALLSLCKNYRSRFTRKSPEIPFENFITILIKFPWKNPEIIAMLERDQLYEFYKLATSTLRGHMNKKNNPFSDGSLMTRMVRAALLSPGFSTKQKKQILAVSKISCPHDLNSYLEDCLLSPALSANNTLNEDR